MLFLPYNPSHSQLLGFFACLFFIFCFSRTTSHYVLLVSMELCKETRLTFNSKKYSCLYFLRPRIKGLHHHTLPIFEYLLILFYYVYYVYLCVGLCEFVQMCFQASGGQKRVLDLLELELPTIYCESPDTVLGT